jgi:outer membrane protein OmpU
MKHTLLASTALVALTSAANAEITISGTARIGIVTTEGSVATAIDTTMAVTGDAATFLDLIDNTYQVLEQSGSSNASLVTARTYSAGFADEDAVTTAERLEVGELRAEIARRTSQGTSTAVRANAVTDLTSIDAIIAAMDGTTSAAVAAVDDKTEAANRVRVSFGLSGETDGGLSYGGSVRADHGGNSTSGSQYISGAFGKVSMGDLNGADEVTAGNLSGVGFSGMGGASAQEFTYQSSSHNLRYEISMSGVTFAASVDTVYGATANSGSNSALGLKWSSDVGGTNVTVGLGQSKVGTSTQDTYSATVAAGGLSITAISSTNDNGPATTATAVATGTTGTAHTAVVAAVDNYDTDHTGLSLTYTMDAMSVTAFSLSTKTSGVADKDYSGLGMSYSLGDGATLKAGFVNSDDTSLMDFGVNFSF